MSDPSDVVGLLDAPLNFPRLIDYWLSLPESCDVDVDPEDEQAILEEGRRIVAVLSRRPVDRAALEALQEDSEHFEEELSYIRGLNDDELARFQDDLNALRSDGYRGLTRTVRPGGDLERYSKELLWLLHCDQPEVFLPTSRSIGALAAACGPGVDPGVAIGEGMRRVLESCRAAGLSPTQTEFFLLWLTKLDQLFVWPTDAVSERCAKDIAWQLIAPESGEIEPIVLARNGAVVSLDSTIDFVDELARDQFGLIEDQSAPCRIIRVRVDKSRARFFISGAHWAWNEKDGFASGASHTILCGILAPMEHPNLLQIKLRKFLPDRLPREVIIDHRSAWLKRDGRNAERRSAWEDAIRAFGGTVASGAAVHGIFRPVDRRFAGSRLAVRDSIIRELLVRSAFEDVVFLKLLDGLCPGAAEAIRRFGAEPDDHGLEYVEDEDEEQGDDGATVESIVLEKDASNRARETEGISPNAVRRDERTAHGSPVSEWPNAGASSGLRRIECEAPSASAAKPSAEPPPSHDGPLADYARLTAGEGAAQNDLATAKNEDRSVDRFDSQSSTIRATLLVKSDMYRSIASRFPRGTLPVDQVERFVAALEHGHGTLTFLALARRAGVAEERVRGMITALRRILNSGGVEVLRVDEASATVQLDMAALDEAFTLERK